MQAVGYIRRSASEESPVSEDTQRATIARLAAERGDTVMEVYRDWGKSGGSEVRPEYLRMLERLEENGIGAVYAYDQDRLARNAWLFLGLLRLADLHGFAVITPAGNLAEERNRDFAEMRGLMDGAELRKMRKRAKGIHERQVKRGDDLGIAPFGYDFAPRTTKSDEPVRFVCVDPEGIAHVLATMREVGTLTGTAKRLNAEGFATRHGAHEDGRPRLWAPNTVRSVVKRHAPELLEGITRGKRGASRPRALSRLLKCHCGGPMTATNTFGDDAWYCSRGRRGAHGGRRAILDSRLMPWVMAEAARLRTPEQVLMAAPGSTYDDTKERDALAPLLASDVPAVVEAGRAALAALDEKRAKASGLAMQVADVPPAVDWSAPADVVNRVLRAMWSEVRLGEDLMPVEAAWRAPEWRA